jgi:hypothetical protein
MFRFSWAYVRGPGRSSRYERPRLGPRLHHTHALCGPCVSRRGFSPSACGRRTRAELHIQDIGPRMPLSSAAPGQGACCTHPYCSFPCSGLRTHGTLLFYGSRRMEEAKRTIGSIDSLGAKHYGSILMGSTRRPACTGTERTAFQWRRFGRSPPSQSVQKGRHRRR